MKYYAYVLAAIFIGAFLPFLVSQAASSYSPSFIQVSKMVYPQHGQTLGTDGHYLFKVFPVTGAEWYVLELSQGGQIKQWYNYTGEFRLNKGTADHNMWQEGNVNVRVAYQKGGVLSPIHSFSIYLISPAKIQYPVQRQTLDLEGSYMFKAQPVLGAESYRFMFFQGGKKVYDNLHHGGVSKNGEWAIHPNDSMHRMFNAGAMEVQVVPWIDGQWGPKQVIKVNLVAR